MALDPAWEAVFRHGNWGRYPGEDLIRFVARNFFGHRPRRDIHVLELGPGPGANLWFLAREGFTVYGVEGAPSAVEQARARLDDECPGWQGDVLVGDFAELPFEDGRFDAVIDNEAVYCNDFATSCAIYAGARRVLKPGGRLFVRTFATGSWGDGTGEAAGRRAWRPTEGPMAGKGFSRFTALDDLDELLAGYCIDSVEQLSRSAEGRRHHIVEWVVAATRPAAA